MKTYTIPKKVDLECKKNNMKNYVALKIPALRGTKVKAKTNLMVLELLAMEGPQTVWNINKLLARRRELYPTILKAVKRLKTKGYLVKTGTVKMAKKKGRTPTYGLTWRGLIASLESEKVCSNILTVLQKNPQLQLPISKDLLLAIGELYGNRIEVIVRGLFEGFLKAIPQDIESIEEKEYGWYLFPALGKMPKDAVEEMMNIDSHKFVAMLKEHPELLNYCEVQNERYIKDLEKTLENAKATRQVIQSLRTLPLEGLEHLKARFLKS